MSNFDSIIGYETIKAELRQICDMIHNREVYEKLGAKLPHGVLLYGAPGLGKTSMAKCFILESGINAYTVRRNKADDDFVSEITGIFEKAKKNAPSIVFLDDMDKFANEDECHQDAQEYVAVQAGIDDVKNSDVFVIGTVNNLRKLPRSLTRPGRFDRKIEVCRPTEKDAEKIIAHYLKSKRIAEDVNLEDVAKMISYSSCAELETIMNEAAICAAFSRRESISMDDMVKAVLRMQYESPDNYTQTSQDELKRTAIHEAGHLVVCEVLKPGSVGLASLRSSGRGEMDGFIRRCTDITVAQHIIVTLAGKAAVELYYPETCANGCGQDIRNAIEEIRADISENCICGFGLVDVTTNNIACVSEDINARNEAAVHAELEKSLFKARCILIKNRDFLEKVASALLDKGTLMYSDIRAIRESITIVDVVA